jgi:conjugative transfer region protein TrbK
MGSRLFNIPAISRAIGFALVATIAIVAAALHFRHDAQSLTASPPEAAAAPDPLAAELARCQTLAIAAEDDALCEAAWARNRRRFFTDAAGSRSGATDDRQVGTT